MSNTKLISGNYQVSLNDFKILCSNTGPITITLPKSPILGTSFIIGDVIGTASLNNITIVPSTGLLVNGGASYVISTDYGKVNVVQDNDNLDQTIFSSAGGASNINNGTTEGSTTYQDDTLGLQVENLNIVYNQVNDTLSINSGIIHKYLYVDADYTPTTADYGMLVDTTLGAIIITLPLTPTDGQTFFIKDVMGTSPLNTITINGNGINIDGSGSFVINQPYESYTVIYNTITNQQSLI